MEFDQKEEAPFNIPEKKKADKKTLAIYIITGVISLSSLIYGYASYQAAYFKDAEIQKLKSELEEANIKLLRIDALENQVKELEASLVAKAAAKASVKKDIKKVNAATKAAKKSKTKTKPKEKKPVKK